MQAAARKVKGADPQPDRDLPGNFRRRGMLTSELAQRKDVLSVKYDLCRSDLRAGVAEVFTGRGCHPEFLRRFFQAVKHGRCQR